VRQSPPARSAIEVVLGSTNTKRASGKIGRTSLVQRAIRSPNIEDERRSEATRSEVSKHAVLTADLAEDAPGPLLGTHFIARTTQQAFAEALDGHRYPKPLPLFQNSQ
jgi:hypothetical protein